MDKDFLTLKRAPSGPNEEDYEVLFGGVLVGRGVLSPFAPKWPSVDVVSRPPRPLAARYEPTREAAGAPVSG